MDAAPDARFRRNRVSLRSALDAHADPRHGRQHLRLRHHAGGISDLASRWAAAWPARSPRSASAPPSPSRSTQVAVGVLSVGVYAWMGPLIPSSLTTYTLAVFAVAVMSCRQRSSSAPRCPFPVRVLARNEKPGHHQYGASIYAWNTVGAILGAIAAGFFLIPGLGFEGAIRVAVAINFALALWAAVCVARPQAGPRSGSPVSESPPCWPSTIRAGPRRCVSSSNRVRARLPERSAGTVLRSRPFPPR